MSNSVLPELADTLLSMCAVATFDYNSDLGTV